MKKQLLAAFLSGFTMLCSAQAPSFQWTGAMGGSSYDSGNAIAVDASGNVYTAGYFATTTDFDPGPGTATLTCNGNYDAYLCKLDASGSFVWVKHVVAGNSTAYALALKTDASGSIYVGGVFDGTADLDPSAGTNTVTAAGNDDMFISKFDPSGNLSWAKTFGGSGYEALNAICCDASGNVYATGFFSSTVDFDPSASTFTLSAAAADVFVLKLSTSGAFVWAKQFSGTGTNAGSAISDGPSGKIYVAGNFESTVDFDPGVSTFSLTAQGIYDSYIVQLDASGNFGWAKQTGGAGEYCYGYALATDAGGNVYRSGTFSGTADLDPGVATQTVTSAGNYDIYISKLSSTGAFLWGKAFGGTDDDYAYGMATDAANVYVTGSFAGTADFDPAAGTSTLTAIGDDDMFITKFDGSGNFVWTSQYGGASSEVYGYAIYVNSASDIFTTGSFNFIEDFDPSPATYSLSSVGFTDAFTLKLSQCVAPAAPVITSTTSAALLICAGNQANLTATGTGTVSWYASPTGTTVLGTGTAYTTPTLSLGTYTYYAGASTCTTSATRASVTVTVNICPGIESLHAGNPEIVIYPNPTNGKLYLKRSSEGNYSVRVYDLLGNMILEQELNEETNLLNLGSYANGIYLLKVCEGQRVLSVKRIVKE